MRRLRALVADGGRLEHGLGLLQRALGTGTPAQCGRLSLGLGCALVDASVCASRPSSRLLRCQPLGPRAAAAAGPSGRSHLVLRQQRLGLGRHALGVKRPPVGLLRCGRRAAALGVGDALVGGAGGRVRASMG
jgi:hypothetical protein